MKRAMVLMCIYLAVLLIFGIVLNTKEKAITDSYETVSYTVSKGDTYDKIAEKLNIAEDNRIWRERVKVLNAKENSELFEGETIYILAENNHIGKNKKR